MRLVLTGIAICAMAPVACTAKIGGGDKAAEDGGANIIDAAPAESDAQDTPDAAPKPDAMDESLPCVEGDVQQEEGETCYLVFVTDVKTWVDAKAACAAIGAQLVSIEDEAEQAIVGALAAQAFAMNAANPDVFVGGSDQTTEQTWVWESGAELYTGGPYDGSPVTTPYHNFRVNEPNNSTGLCVDGEDCLIIEGDTDDLTWDDRCCAVDSYPYICERNPALL